MESNRCGQTMEESSDVVEVSVIPDDPPSSQDITVPSVSSPSSSCSSSSASRVTPAQVTCPMPRGSAASLPVNEIRIYPCMLYFDVK